MTRAEGARSIGVLIVEDSEVIRDYLVYLIESNPIFRVVGTVESGEAALEFVRDTRPDVILMDIHLPGIDGLETTRRIMAADPVPIVVCTASTRYNEVDTVMRALEAGALTAVRKPVGLGSPRASEQGAALVMAVKLMSEVKVVRRRGDNHRPPTPYAPVERAPGRNGRHAVIVAIGASTGGPPALRQLLSALPSRFPLPIVVVQHISTGFVAAFADWLSRETGMEVHVAKGGETPLPGHVYLADDHRHLRVGHHGLLEVGDDDPHYGVRPSAGVLFRSVAERFGRRAIGVLLTGMGRDGAAELKLMADRGALTVAQDRESSVVFGMPGEAVRLGAAQYVLPPREIAELLASRVQTVGGYTDDR